MESRLVYMVVVWGLLSVQGVLRVSAARPVFDVTGIPFEPERSGQNSEVDEGYQHNLKSTAGCKEGSCTTFAVQSTSSRSPQTNRVLVNSSCLRRRKLVVEPATISDSGTDDSPGHG